MISRWLPKQAWSALLLGLCFFLTNPSHGQEKIDLQALIQETQRTEQGSGKLTLVWWLPEQFWEASTSQNPAVTKEQIDQVLKTIRPYTIVAVVAGDVGSFGGVTYRSEEAIRTAVTIKDTEGLSYSPLGESEIDPDTKNLMQLIKPVIVNMLGPLGQNMHFILFPAKTKDGQPIADATKEGLLSIGLGDQQFKYRLPLGSVLPPKYDPKTGEKFPGNYTYNPFTGSELVAETQN
jgi:hypothetical protein